MGLFEQSVMHKCDTHGTYHGVLHALCPMCGNASNVLAIRPPVEPSESERIVAMAVAAREVDQ